jgi:hypothetical protein
MAPVKDHWPQGAAVEMDVAVWMVVSRGTIGAAASALSQDTCYFSQQEDKDNCGGLPQQIWEGGMEICNYKYG